MHENGSPAEMWHELVGEMATEVGGSVAGSYEYDNEAYDVDDVKSGAPSIMRQENVVLLSFGMVVIN